MAISQLYEVTLYESKGDDFTARNSKGKMRKYIIHELFDVDKVILGSV